MNKLFVTHFNNKTWGENLRYNNKKQLTLYEIQQIQICNHLEKFSIPLLEKLSKKHRKLMFCSNDACEKKVHRKNMHTINKDILLLKNQINSFYHNNIERLFDNLQDTNYNKSFIYNVPNIIHESVNDNSCIFVLEMNNDLNKVTGIFKMRNTLCLKRHIIYSDMNYNRYTYIGKRKDRSCFNEETMEIIDEYLFKGSTHQKRGQGIQRINVNISRSIFKLIQSELKYFN